jgi:hypothetical protein
METVQNTEMTLFGSQKAKTFCSIVAETEVEKKTLFNALEECDALLNDCVGQEIDLNVSNQWLIVEDQFGNHHKIFAN